MNLEWGPNMRTTSNEHIVRAIMGGLFKPFDKEDWNGFSGVSDHAMKWTNESDFIIMDISDSSGDLIIEVYGDYEGYDIVDLHHGTSTYVPF